MRMYSAGDLSVDYSSRPLFSYLPYWAECFGVAPFLPMSRAGMDELGWDSCDIILISGDAYVDHPSFGAALIGRLLEAQGFRVGVIAQPDWRSADAFRLLGRPNLFFGITAGAMDSMVNHYTSDRKIRSDDAYTPNGEAGRRPNRAITAYSQRCREAWPGVNVVIGSVEASLRRVAHYDYWSDSVRHSALVDSKADLLIYGNAERAIVALAHRLAAGETMRQIRDLRGTGFMMAAGRRPDGEWVEINASAPGATPGRDSRSGEKGRVVIRLPSFEQVRDSAPHYAQASRLIHLESNPDNARALVQAHGDRDVWLNPPSLPLMMEELDRIHELPYQRRPHPSYGESRIPAYEMIRFSLAIVRGCFGGCAFCSIAGHEGRIVQSRSEGSVLREIEAIRDRTPEFTGIVSDLGGPTANMYRMGCRDARARSLCRRFSCVYPEICKNLETDHSPLIRLYRAARAVKGVRRVLIASGLRYDLAMRSPEYIRELAAHHVGGYLKIAPEHTEPGPLAHMMKPGIAAYDRFKALFEKFAREAGKELYLIPYFIAAHPGTSDEDMLNLALWLKRNAFRPDQVQTFLPAPMAAATAMYHARCNPLKKIGTDAPRVEVTTSAKKRRLHKAFLRYHDPANWSLLREALRRMGRADLIGSGKHCLVPAFRIPDTRASGKRKNA
ncbi:MAG: YgiQ family radical SAM protein [Candidatus Accumulibacter sp.]|jgi:uncharacterized radical SAM protein YgiQ|nr:YgiQ family radical SAM protein [Accumulibacter sp.]